jgi:hypothetical protein
MFFPYTHRYTTKKQGKDVWNFPHQREIPYIKKKKFRSAEGSLFLFYLDKAKYFQSDKRREACCADAQQASLHSNTN